MRIPHQLLKCVGFISHDQPTPDYLGTVFLVSVQSQQDPGRCAIHLVTARHVAELIDPGPFLIGMNAKDGTKLLLKSNDAQWWYHPSEKSSVDVAVTPFCPGMFSEYDIEWIPEIVLLTDQSILESGVGLGDEIFTVGLFTKFFGSSRFEPIVRTGNIAMMPGEKIPLKGSGPAEAYLVEGRSIGGLSGSPVFVRPTIHIDVQSKDNQRAQLGGLSSHIRLLGLMLGHWELPLTFKKTEQAEAVNMGVAIVVPANKILETLYHPELVQMRRELDEKKQDYPAMDAVPVKEHLRKRGFTAPPKKASPKAKRPRPKR